VRSINSDGTLHTERERETNSNGEKGVERKREEGIKRLIGKGATTRTIIDNRGVKPRQ